MGDERVIRCHGEARKAIRRFTMPRAPFTTTLRVADHLEATWIVPDRDAAGTTVKVTMRAALVLPCTEATFFAQARDLVLRVYAHEAREAILVDGVRRYDPIEEHGNRSAAPQPGPTRP